MGLIDPTILKHTVVGQRSVRYVLTAPYGNIEGFFTISTPIIAIGVYCDSRNTRTKDI